MIVVSDTSSITALLQIDKAELLTALYGDVFIPAAVQAELARGHAAIPNFLQVVAIKDLEHCRALMNDLDVGESEAIVLAHELHADYLLMDERRGRERAIQEGLKVIGLLGALLDAKQRGLIPLLRPVLAGLEARAGFRVSAAVQNYVLGVAGE